MCIKCTNTFTFAENKPTFRELIMNADEVNAGSIEATEVESLLIMECEKNVSTQVYTV